MKSHFRCGHANTPDNRYVYPGQSPRCLTCKLRRNSEHYAANKDVAKLKREAKKAGAA